jgi:TolB-like protein
MITKSGQVKMMDFGLAKWIDEKQEDQSKAETQSQLTGEGLVLGTIPYMSPEQVKRERLDARSDIFSFGVVLYEMIAGKRPFAAGSAAANASAILTEDPLPLSRYSPNIPTEVERIVRKCLEKDRNRRYQMIQEATIDLENAQRDSKEFQRTYAGGVSQQRKLRFVGLTFALIAIALASSILLTRKPALNEPQIKSLAVLPLENLSGDSTQEYFADGMTEALINNLAKIRALRVISRTSVMRYKGTRKSLPEIARELHVDAVIEGSVQRSGDQVRVTAQLIHAETDANIWSREYERDLTDVLKLQSDVAQAVANEIRIQVTPEERNRLASARTINPEAHEAYLLGRHYTEIGNEQSWKQAIQYFEQAIQLSPDYAPAHAGLSRAWLQLGIFGAKLREVESSARAASLKAIELDNLAEGHTTLGNIKYYCDWDWSGSEQQFKRALQLNPGGLDTHIAYGHFLMVLGRHNEAIKEGELGVQLDPVSAESRTALGRFLYRGRKTRRRYYIC